MADDRLNLGIGKTIALSSNARGEMPAADDILAGTPDGRFSFHTRSEADPWLRIDLHESLPIGRLTIWNREDVGLAGLCRALPLHIEHSQDAETWEGIATLHLPFGGVRSGTPFSLSLPYPLHARYLRLTVRATTPFHLDRVLIESPALPPADTFRYGRLDRLRILEGRLAVDVVVAWNAGFFSTASVALHMAVHAAGLGFLPAALDVTRGFGHFSAGPEDAARLFAPNSRIPLPPIVEANQVFHSGHVHRHYRDFPFAILTPFIDRLFRPAPDILALGQDLVARHRLDLARTLLIYYRGTDKVAEIPPTDIAEYIALAERLLADKPGHRVCIQTDQQQIRDRVLAHFGDRAVAIGDLPVTEGSVGIHTSDLGQYGLDRARFGRLFLAAIEALSGADIILTSTGNVGGWLALYRGHARKLYQFDRQQRLVEPYP